VSGVDIETPHGPARAHVHALADPRALLVLGHGAGGGIEAPDLVAVTKAANDEGVAVALVEQPYRVAGRRSSPRAPQLDVAWEAAIAHLRTELGAGLPLIPGGRSAGARVACRTAQATGAAAVLCLAFPLEPPRRRDGSRGPSRLSELEAVAVPTLVVQGERDRFGMPPPGPAREVVSVPGDHALKADTGAVAAAARSWLAKL
jgi:predicted alpha/beta-hydrolase family hydrolase